MSQTLIVHGVASQRKYNLEFLDDEMKENLLLFLLSKNIPIAYSCKGEGICNKCIINDELKSCSLNLKEYIKKYGNELKISYL